MKNTFQELELLNGDKVKLTLNFAKLLSIKNNEEDLYARFMNILGGKDVDIIVDSLTVLYVGYLCANSDQVLSEEEFMELVPFDLELINVLAGKLIMSKKK